jgi:hypothetical protein
LRKYDVGVWTGSSWLRIGTGSGHLSSSSSSSSSSCICHGVGPLVHPFRSPVSRSLFKGLPWFVLPVGEWCFITLGNLLRGILFACCIHFLLCSSNLSKIGVIFISYALVNAVMKLLVP